MWSLCNLLLETVSLTKAQFLIPFFYVFAFHFFQSILFTTAMLTVVCLWEFWAIGMKYYPPIFYLQVSSLREPRVGCLSVPSLVFSRQAGQQGHHVPGEGESIAVVVLLGILKAQDNLWVTVIVSATFVSTIQMRRYNGRSLYEN